MLHAKNEQLKKTTSGGKPVQAGSNDSSLMCIGQVDSVKLKTSFEFCKRKQAPKELQKIKNLFAPTVNKVVRQKRRNAKGGVVEASVGEVGRLNAGKRAELSTLDPFEGREDRENTVSLIKKLNRATIAGAQAVNAPNGVSRWELLSEERMENDKSSEHSSEDGLLAC